MSTPATTIYLCKGVPLTNRYDHTMLFGHSSVQDKYFKSKVARTLTAYTYIRKSWKLKVDATMEAARVWSYLYFKNGTGKTYYYFINQIEYINDNTVELTLELDVMQTYQFDWQLRQCYVEREHSVTDAWGENTIDEGLNVGELIVNDSDVVDLSSNLVVMTAASIDINEYHITGGESENKICGSFYDKIFGGFEITATPSANWQDLTVLLNFLNTKGKIDTIFTMWEYPAQLISTDYGNYEYCVAPYVSGTNTITQNFKAHPTIIDGYRPKNNKVLQYPYCFIYVTNNNGGAAVYHYEKFADTGTLKYKIEGNISPDAVVKLTPLSYKGVGTNYDESLTLGNYPLCAWNTDSYKMWLAQNQNQQNMSFAMSGLKILGGAAAIVGGAIATGGTAGAGAVVGVGGVTAGASMIASGATDIAAQLTQRADKEIQPPQARGNYSGSHNIARGTHNFYIHYKSIDAYHAEVIDNYFSMYGYATRKVKIPNIQSRPSWNYVKTIGSNVGGNICMEDLKVINAIFDKGITFWKNFSGTNIAVGDYTLDNTP